ncbi:hypothetical protein C8Q74DRAFT_1441020 [Fomes fomentarius]|nr:hypothetical protein C8Q74DRAFT_1441020 [Fomes fomentarius]
MLLQVLGESAREREREREVVPSSGTALDACVWNRKTVERPGGWNTARGSPGEGAGTLTPLRLNSVLGYAQVKAAGAGPEDALSGALVSCQTLAGIVWAMVGPRRIRDRAGLQVGIGMRIGARSSTGGGRRARTSARPVELKSRTSLEHHSRRYALSLAAAAKVSSRRVQMGLQCLPRVEARGLKKLAPATTTRRIRPVPQAASAAPGKTRSRKGNEREVYEWERRRGGWRGRREGKGLAVSVRGREEQSMNSIDEGEQRSDSVLRTRRDVALCPDWQVAAVVVDGEDRPLAGPSSPGYEAARDTTAIHLRSHNTGG